MYTVKEISTLAGVSVRTLHYYDQIGLLTPTRKAENGYRQYDDAALLRLQQILFYRELDFKLLDIRALLDDPNFDQVAALEEHGVALIARLLRVENLIATVDDTIKHLKGEKEMSKKALFEAFSEEKQAEYAKEAEEKYDPEIVRASNRKWKGYSAEKKQTILDEGNQVYVDMIAAMPKGADSSEAQAVVKRWRKHMDYFWTPNLDQLLGLATMYGQSPEFKTKFDAMHPDLTTFFREAVEIYVANK
ncbi:MAG: MerR family transcriptional regulator [Anaerolineae bacterium]|jgi:MerR family transcriptional regulator, thiopeptide resistance regulator|nr:MerR family transcriptional regulator [Anaerolineae bacterium]MBT7074071.1 MerR family transcriptional regulator [Anaerolineae bacterium]MBT7782808.1 MerR family transcriptional regulator [Anaerolineae bacterium]